jgi:cell division transport system permease protein
MIGAGVISGSANDRLLPQGRLAGPMPWIVAIMIFLTTLACAAGIALGEGAARMRDAVANRLTVQVTEPDAEHRAVLTERVAQGLAKVPGVASVSVQPRDRLVAQLEPWLGADAGSGDIPIPALVDVDLSATGPAAETTRAAVARAVTAIGKEARVEPHGAYIAPVVTLVRTIGWIAFAIVALMAVATSFVVVLAARGAHSGHRSTIDIMHMLGATDSQVMRLFQRRMTRDISFGAAVGLFSAIAMILLVGRSAAVLASDLMGSIALPWWGWVVLPLLPVLFITVAWFAARLTLASALSRSL